MEQKKSEVFKRMKEHAVQNCVSVLDFAYKYYKPDRFTGRGIESVEAILLRLHKEILESGFACISRHDNVTGKLVTYIPSSAELKEIKRIWPERIQAARKAADEQEAKDREQARRRKPRKHGGPSL